MGASTKAPEIKHTRQPSALLWPDPGYSGGACELL